MKFLRKYPLLAVLAAVLSVLLLWSLWGNTALTVTEYTIQDNEIPLPFSGLRIAQVSDLHNAEFGEGNRKLLDLLQSTQPDMILLTGDLIDSRRTDLKIAIDFVRESVKIAPTYYVPGNHEARLSKTYEALKAEMEAAGVTILENTSTVLTRQDASVTVTGLMDPDFLNPSAVLPELACENYQIVLSHRPELLSLYAQYGLNLVFTGHAHGGQFRLPFVGGLYAPHQGFFPQYTSGVHTMEKTSMVVSRGLGNSLFPIRFNNRPELIFVTLKAA